MSRRLVVVLFVDLVDWTRLVEQTDPEPLQHLLESYYDICSTAVEYHGGVVEKYIGDAVMAVFGAVTAQEDDALRALSAAFEIRTRVAALPTRPGSAAGRIGVHSGVAAGEALVTHSPRAGLRVVGDVVNLAARLQGTAAAGEVLVDEVTARLLGRGATLERRPPVVLKGKSRPQAVARVTAVRHRGDADCDTDGGVAMVNRSAETAQLRAALERARTERRVQLVTVVGPAGIGKTRLVHEALRGDGRVVSGTFAPYGPCRDSIAIGQVLDALLRESLECLQVVEANPHLAGVLAGLRHPCDGEREVVEEVSWALREIVAAAAEHGLTVVWDGLDWAGHGFPELLGDLMDRLRDRAVLVVCVARSLSDVPWLRLVPGEVVHVAALSAEHSTDLAAALLGPDGDGAPHTGDVVDRMCAYAAGNPLFLQLLLEGGPVDLRSGVPSTITALVGAMIDRVPADAQELLGAASVVGTAFAAGQLRELGVSVTPDAMDPLVERQLVRPGPVADEYRFTQQAVHEVAYARLEKRRRLDWHRRAGDAGIEAGFHYDAAACLLRELRPDDPGLPALAGRAAAALLADGTAARRQHDTATAIDLLDRARRWAGAAGEPGAGQAVVAAVRLADALLSSGDAVGALAVVAPDRDLGAPAVAALRAAGLLLGLRTGALADDAAVAAAAELLAGLATGTVTEPVAAADVVALARCRAEQVPMLAHLAGGRYGAAERAAQVALGCAEALGDPYEQDRLHVALCEIRQWSPSPIAGKLAACAELADRFADDRFLLVPVLTSRARYSALRGDAEAAWSVLAEAGAAVDELRIPTGHVLVEQTAALICRLTGEDATAEAHFRRAAAGLAAAGLARPALTLQVQAVRARARAQPDAPPDELDGLLERRVEMDGPGQLLVVAAGALAAARRHPARAAALVALAQELLAGTDDPYLRGEVLLELGATQHELGAPDAAEALVEAAHASFAAIGARPPLATAAAGR